MSDQPSRAPRAARVYCSEVANLADSPIHGTAVQVHTWLLIEYARPWKPKALVDNDLPASLNTHLAGLPDAYRDSHGELLRVQFVKQASSADQARPRVFVAHSERGLFMREYDHLSDLETLSAESIAAPTLAGFEHQDESITLVCTNGQRDVCCARFGLPVYESLREEFGRRVWQTTHVGGHRYAPNVLHLPSGLLFGFVAAEEAPLLQHKLDQGVMTLHRLRGRSCYSSVAQAGEYFARVAVPNRGIQDLQLVEENREGNVTRLCFTDGADKTIRVALSVSKTGPVLASCDAEPKPVEKFELQDIEIS